MAVQTHHHCNLKQYNKLNVEVLGESVANLSNGGNPRKRERGAAVNGDDLYFVQSQPSVLHPQKMIRLDKVHQPALVSNGDYSVNQMNCVLQSSYSSSPLRDSIYQSEREIDQLLQIKGEQLRLTIAKRLETHYKQLLQIAERSASQTLRMKQVELDRAVQQTNELQNQLMLLQTQSLALRTKAMASQATANSLYAQLQQTVAAIDSTRVNPGELPAEDAESAYIDPNRPDHDITLVCRACQTKTVSVVILPCRHLCLCENCGVTSNVKGCPLCNCIPSGCVQVLLS